MPWEYEHYRGYDLAWWPERIHAYTVWDAKVNPKLTVFFAHTREGAMGWVDRHQKGMR